MSIKIAFLVLAPIFGLFMFFLLRFYNSGIYRHSNENFEGNLKSKRWAKYFGIISAIGFIFSVIFYFIAPDITILIKGKGIDNELMDRIFTLLNGLVFFGTVIQNIFAKQKQI